MTSRTASVRPIEQRSVSEQATDELRRCILNGVLEPGTEVSLRGLADMLNVSFIPVRDALRVLEGEGLVVTRAGRSARVAPLVPQDLQAIYRLRRVLEPEIASRACMLLSEAELDRLEYEAAAFGDSRFGTDDVYDSHHAFHTSLLAPAATAWDARLLSVLWRASERYVRIGFGKLDAYPHEHERREQAHEGLVAAFRTRDPDVAADAVREHLARNEQLATRALVGDDQPGGPPGGPAAKRTRSPGRAGKDTADKAATSRTPRAGIRKTN